MNSEEILERHMARLGWRAELPHVIASLALLGKSGSRSQVPTPAAIVDLNVLEINVERMARRVAAAGYRLRPHAKTHKSGVLAELQLSHGAVGLCCAKLAEAEALAAAGIGPLLVTSPLIGDSVLRRAAALARRSDGLLLVADAEEQIEALSAALAASGARVGVMIDVDVGLGRTGVTRPDDAVALAERIEAAANLQLAGVQGYGGHWQHQPGRTARRDAVAEGMVRLTEAIEAVEAHGHEVSIRTGGGTGTVASDLELGVLNDLQPGSYLLMDQQYRTALGDDDDGRFGHALTIQAQVVATGRDGWITLDAGFKAFATDADPPVLTTPDTGGSYLFFGDEHGMLLGDTVNLARPGDRFEFIPPHCDPTIDRYDILHIVRGDTLLAVVPVDARGCSQ